MKRGLVARMSSGDALDRSRAANTVALGTCEALSDRSLRGEARDAYSDGKATTLRRDLALFRGCYALRTSMCLWAVQVAPTPRIRPREVQRDDESEAHGASKSRPSNIKLATRRMLVRVCCMRRK